MGIYTDLLSRLSTAKPDDFTNMNHLLRRVQPSAEERAEFSNIMAEADAIMKQSAQRLEAWKASNNIESHNTYLPNITNLSLESAIKMKGFVEVDIEQGTDKGNNICGRYGDKEVKSLEEYLSLITDYINGKSASSTPSSPTQPTPTETTPVASAPTVATSPAEPVAGADPNWTDPVGKPGQNHIFFPNVAALSGETAAAVYKQVSSMVQSQDISQSVIHAHNGSAGTYSVDTYMSWLAQRAATNILA